MDFSIDMLDVQDADAFIIWIRDNNRDYVIFLDGGNSDDGQKAIDHYNKYIRDKLFANKTLYIINTHPHRDHINGLFSIVEYFKTEIDVVIYNNPLTYITDARIKDINEAAHETNADPDVIHLYETLKKMQEFEDLLAKYTIPVSQAFSNIDYGGLFKILSPSKEYYESLVKYFINLDVLLTESFAPEPESIVNEVEEGNNPCTVVDEKNDASPENLSSVILQLTDSQGRRYLFTADAGVDSFLSAEENGFSMNNFYNVQLPHHGSRRNINTNWICKFNPTSFIISAAGNKKHPRKAVIDCIKKNIPGCNIYSTHKGGQLQQRSNAAVFSLREGWSNAISL